MDRNEPERCPVNMKEMTYEVVANFMVNKKKKASTTHPPHMMAFDLLLFFYTP